MSDADLSLRNPGRRASDHEDMPAVIKHAIKEAIHESLSDPELVKGFWRRGYEEFTGHAASGASQWVGKRILTALITALFVFAVGYLVKNGALK